MRYSPVFLCFNRYSPETRELQHRGRQTEIDRVVFCLEDVDNGLYVGRESLGPASHGPVIDLCENNCHSNVYRQANSYSIFGIYPDRNMKSKVRLVVERT